MKNTTLNNRYFIQELISQGGFCSVYKGFDIYDKYFKNETQIAIKIPNEEFLNKEDIEAFLYAEYIFLKEMNHENIVKVLDFGIDSFSNKPYLILEYLEGKLLSEVFDDNLSLNEKNKIFRNLVKTLDYIHSKGVIHCDISPSNIIIYNGKITIFDFGSSQYINNNKIYILDFDKNNVYNPKYTAPEIIDGEKPSIYSDFYSLSLVVLELYGYKSSLLMNKRTILKDYFYNFNSYKIPFYISYWLNKNRNKNPNYRIINKIWSYIFI